MSLCRCGCKGEAPEGKGFIEGHRPGKKPVQNPTERSEVSISCEKKSLPYPPKLETQISEPIRPPVIQQQPPPPPTRRDREIQLMELELKQIDKYMGDRHQNTQITEDERLILSILRKDVAMHPWAVSQRICRDMGIPFDEKEFEIDILKDFIDDYLDFGLPLKRVGREEVKDIFRAYFDGKNAQEEKPKEKLIT